MTARSVLIADMSDGVIANEGTTPESVGLILGSFMEGWNRVATHRLLTIRAAEADDISLILEFVRELADYEKLLHEVVAEENDISAALFGASPTAFVIIAELGDEPVGFALYHTMFSTFIGKTGIYLEDLYIRPEYRSHGVGTSLLKHLAGIAVENNYCRLDWSVLTWNQSAIDFYEGIGAYALDDWVRYRLDGKALKQLSE